MIAFHILDMSSPRCGSAITKALRSVDHLAVVRVDLVSRTVEIEPGHATARELGDAIRQAGYSPAAT